jgi:hypothetical protein
LSLTRVVPEVLDGGRLFELFYLLLYIGEVKDDLPALRGFAGGQLLCPLGLLACFHLYVIPLLAGGVRGGSYHLTISHSPTQKEPLPSPPLRGEGAAFPLCARRGLGGGSFRLSNLHDLASEEPLPSPPLRGEGVSGLFPIHTTLLVLLPAAAGAGVVSAYFLCPGIGTSDVPCDCRSFIRHTLRAVSR